ncbi:odorant receptor 131-2-like [Pygocentrus nattereri]|uniref:G-protein coupled receptors family 1 profile domain-containing protein n=1 Tax=Pygocentrus nattereri TaxID=42514 RepID=A0A3B4EA92_PYGNA|nr:odorant receptor 131-2-like [Pygocentrus nattereri]
MNVTADLFRTQDTYQEAFAKNIVIVSLALIINGINGMFVVIFVCNPVFHKDPRYILYINLVINDILMICISVTLYVLTYAWPYLNVSFCCLLIAIASTTHMNTPVILTGMAIERYIAVCKPLHYSQICTLNRTYILIFVIWGIGAVPAVIDVIIVIALQPSSFFNSLTYCQPIIIYNSKYHMQKAIAAQTLYMSIVWITLFYTYFKVLFIAKVASSGHHQNSAKKARNTILLHGGQLLLCMLSYVTPVLDLILIPFFPSHRTKITFFNYLLTNIVPRLLSPLIYGVRDQKFVSHIKRYFSCELVIVKVAP